MRVKITAVALFWIILSFAGSVFSEETTDQADANKQYQIVFSVFDKSSAGSYAYLRDSVQAMLASRLAVKDRVNVLEKAFSAKELAALEKQNPEEPLYIGGKETDYLVTGALFSLTDGLEIQVDLYPLVPEKESLHFSIFSQMTDNLIGDVEKLAREIAQKAFGYQPEPSGQGTQDAGALGDSGFVTVHPEAAYKKKLYTGTIVGIEGSGVTTKTTGVQLKATVPVDMRALAVGDVDGDGEQEILVLAARDLRLFKVAKTEKEDAIVQLAEASLPLSMVSHAVNVADLDGDGRGEIYISATNGLRVSSMIMNYDDTAGFQVVARSIPWYLRPVNVPGKGWRLAGQKRGAARLDLVGAGVYLLQADGKTRFSQGERLPLPKGVNLFDFAYADLDGDSFYEVVVVDQKEKLRVYSPGNELMWVSQKTFGGSNVYLGPSQGGATSQTDQRNFTIDEDRDRELIFVPARIIVTDIDGDGKEEIVVSEGKSAITGFLRFFNRLRYYSSGAVVSLAWNDSALVESWRTGNFKGYVAGYAFSLLQLAPSPETTGDATGGTIETSGRLFVGNLPKLGTMADLLPGSGETQLNVYDLEFIKEKAK